MHAILARNIVGIHYTVRILIGTTLLWFLTQAIHAPSPLWAIISLIIVTEPQVHLAWFTFRMRIINTVLGSVIGFAALIFTTATPVILILAIALTALLSTCVNRLQQGWRIAPITTALIISADMTQGSLESGLQTALFRTLEVFLGSAIAVLITLVMGSIWLPPVPIGEAEKK